MLYRLRLGEVTTTEPTIGFNVESVEYHGLKLTVWDIGGQSALRPLWRHYFSSVTAVIFVVDSADTERMTEAHDELHGLLHDPALGPRVPLLVFANKRDLPTALPESQLGEALDIFAVQRSHTCRLQMCSATIGTGVEEGMRWLATELNK